MCEKLSVKQQEFVRDVANREGISNYVLETNPGSMKGDGYLGIITTARIADKENKKKVLNLVIKSALGGEVLRKQAPVRRAYEREVFMYDVVFSEFQRLQNDLNVSRRFTSIAKCYGTMLDDNNECLALENLKELDYKLWDRKKTMNSDHISFVFAEYGKFHALSLGMKKLRPEKFQDLTKNMANIFEGALSEDVLAESTKANFERAFTAVEGNMEAKRALKRFLDTIKSFFRDTIPTKNKYSVITHGDCWCNNMMFKYDKSNSTKPVSMCLLDWQLSQYGSPILDLSYFFYVCSSKMIMDNLNFYLQIYHDSLSEMLKEMGCDADELFPLRELQTQWRIYSKYGLYMAIIIIKIMLSDVSEAPDLNQLAENGQNILRALDIESVHLEEYNKRLRDVIVSMTKNKFI